MKKLLKKPSKCDDEYFYQNISWIKVTLISLGVTGRVAFDDNADRQPDYWLWSYGSQQSVFEPVVKLSIIGDKSEVVIKSSVLFLFCLMNHHWLSDFSGDGWYSNTIHECIWLHLILIDERIQMCLKLRATMVKTL